MAARVWAALAVVGVLLTGCASSSRGGEADKPGKVPDKVVATPSNQGLVGDWKVEGTEVEPGTIVRLDGDLTMWTSCGQWMGGWRADDAGMFTGMVHGWQGDDCQPPHDGDPTPRWLREVVGYRMAGSTAELLDIAGEVAVRLTPASAPADAPKPSDADPFQSGARSATPLPGDVTQADRSALVGRWAPEGAPASAPEPPFIEIADDGSWTGSDGCNGMNGRWSVGEAGSFGAASGPVTAIGCDGVDVGAAMVKATRAGFVGESLKLFDAAGTELISLVPDR